MRESNWYGINVCVKCESRLNDSQKMYSGGVCPKCGHITKGTVCETNKVVAKEIKHHWRLTTYLHLKHGSNNYFLGRAKIF